MKASSDKFRVRGFQVLENECIWMLSGVVNFRLCDKAYNCYDCAFDKAMVKAMGQGPGKKTDWAESIKASHEGSNRPCRHLLTGRIQQPKICVNDYDCGRCQFDQMLDDLDAAGSRSGIRYREASGYRMADDYYYHPGHTWIRVEHGGLARIGFDDFAMKLFGSARLTRLPAIGARITRERPAWTIEQQGNRARVRSPVTGTVVSVNQRVTDDPDIIHRRPYDDGWLVLVETESPVKGYKDLYHGKEGLTWMDREFNKLNSLLGEGYEGLAATGGEPVSDFFALNPGIGWDTLVDAFLAP
ncbi:MAG: glycine cleavage system protein H [Desulfobacteraceae bacterium]|nr:glycine cleavage system protein H [Desulfobacteraceae bacterium]